MSDHLQSEWHWDEVDPGRIGLSGNFAKMFRGERVKAPGLFAGDLIDDESALLIREAVQNSWDAALETRQQARRQEPHPFEVSFRLFQLSGDERNGIAEALGLDDLSRRATGTADRHTLGLGEQDCLSDGFDDTTPLRLLEIRERAAGGMHGPWQGDESKLYKAMCSLGITPDREGRGGSFGYGKAGLIRGSRIRTVVAYTCFAPRSDDLGVTRRLLGMTYWDTHKYDGASFTGTRWLARSDSTGGRREPYENDEADRVASLLGIAGRDPRDEADHGTTLLLADPAVTADGLIRAAERFWWPALEDGSLQFGLSVIDESAGGGVRHPRPKKNADLLPFIEAFEAATTPQDSKRSDLAVFNLEPSSKAGGYDSYGKLALRSEPTGWSFPEAVEGAVDVEHRSLVALIRDPRMVVEYFDTGARGAPFVRGVFVADEAINEGLRRTENKAHDAWQTSSSAGDIRKEDARTARLLLQQVQQRVRDYRKEVAPKPRPHSAMRFPVWDQLARLLWRGAAPGDRPPPGVERPLSIQPGERLAVADDGRPYVEGAASIGYSDHYTPERPEGDLVEVSLRCSFAAVDGTRQQHTVPLYVEAPQGFGPVAPESDRYRGRIKPGQRATFPYLTDDYDPRWTVEVDVSAEIVTENVIGDAGTESPSQ